MQNDKTTVPTPVQKDLVFVIEYRVTATGDTDIPIQEALDTLRQYGEANILDVRVEEVMFHVEPEHTNG